MSDPSSTLTLRLFNGARLPFNGADQILVTIINGNQKTLICNFYRDNVLNFELPFYDNLGDNYSIIVFADGFRQAGFTPVKLSSTYTKTLDIMLVSKDPGFNFAHAAWDAVSTRYPFLAGDTDDATAKSRYDRLLESERPLACLLNLCEAMSQMHLSQGTPLSYIKQVRWQQPPAQDRFFAYCDPALVNQVRAAAAQKLFAEEPAPQIFHPGATHSWKQIQFGEANLQLTFHENEADCVKVGDLSCVTVEPDIDYYKDPLAHVFLELAINGLTHSLSDPIEVYILRWIAGRQAGVPEFAPLYTLTD